MNSKELNMKLIENMPELKERYLEEVSWQEGNDTGSHVVFSDVFFSYMLETINNQDTKRIKKCFDIIERILMLDDEYAEEVITLSIIENLIYEFVNLDIVYPYMHEHTKQVFTNLKNR